MRLRPPPPPPGHDRFSMFVPAVMSLGLVFWIVTLTRDLFRWRGEQSLDRRARASGQAIAAFLLADFAEPDPRGGIVPGVRRRISYLICAVVCVGVFAYVTVGSIANYLREDGYVGDIAWLLALSLLAASLFAFFGGVAFVVYVAWPTPPEILHGVLRRTPLTGRVAGDDESGGAFPTWALSTSANLIPLAAVTATVLINKDPSAIRRADDAVWSWASGQSWMDALPTLDQRWAVPILVIAALAIGAAGLRCHVFAGATAITLTAALVSVFVAAHVVQRPGPNAAASAASSYPCIRVILAVLLAGLVPVAFAIVTRRHPMIAPLRALGSLGVAEVILSALHEGAAWASDVSGGLLTGLSVVLLVDWSVSHASWHRHCQGCLWAPHEHPPRFLAAISLPTGKLQLIRLLSRGSSVAVAVGFFVLALTAGVPSNPDGSLIDPTIQRPVQLALAAMISLAAIVAWRWTAAAAVMTAIAAVILGVFAGLEYRPPIAVLLTSALLVPAVLHWLSWQHGQRRAPIVALAAATFVLLGATWTGADRVYGHYFGPTHPSSAAKSLPIDRVRWLWSGGLSSRSVTVVAALSGRTVANSAKRASLELEPDGGGPVVRSTPVQPSPDGIARLTAQGLRPDTEYTFRVVVDGVADTTRGVGRIRTPADGPMSFRVAFSSCARVGSNGAVFDAIAKSDPLLYVEMGDIHYSNLDSTDPADFRAAYDRLLTRPGQAALYRKVPIAYVWDDHDYGPNDADNSSPSRSAARQAYREVVPHYGLPGAGDAPIYQAFTVGRVRFVMTDTRSERTEQSMLGDAQERWLIDQLATASRRNALVVWINPDPWIGDADPSSDSWAGQAEERRRIADAIAGNKIDNLVMVSGDAHMVAIDDGSNTDYSTSGGAVFPLLQAAALDRPGSVKGGPYSEGTFPGGGQFGTVDVTDSGSAVSVTLSGWNWKNERLVSWEFAINR